MAKNTGQGEAPAPRERLLDAADELFHRDGIARTGVDQVLERAHVAPGTLYAHFAGKDGLVAAALLRRLERWDRVWQETIDAADGPGDRLLALFDAVAVHRSRFTSARGCAFLTTSTELASAEHPAHAVIEAESALLHSRLRQLADALGVPDPSALAQDLLLLYDGAMTGLLREREPDPLEQARALAGRLVRAATRPVR